MRAIGRRLRRLEDRVAPRPNEEDFRLANILRERQGRRLEAAGEPFDYTPPIPPRALGPLQFASGSLVERSSQWFIYDQPVKFGEHALA
jgi:hypothetical protein